MYKIHVEVKKDDEVMISERVLLHLDDPIHVIVKDKYVVGLLEALLRRGGQKLQEPNQKEL